MHFKLLITLVEDSKTNAIMTAAREAGATGATVLSQARGEGLKQTKTFFGLNLESQRDMKVRTRCLLQLFWLLHWSCELIYQVHCA